MRRLILLLLLAAAACAPGVVATEVPPTLTLIPITATLTPTTAPPTPTPANLSAPGDVIAVTITPQQQTDEVLTGAALIERDPVAAEMVGIAQRVVADDLDLPVVRVRLTDARAVLWTDSTLNCPLPSSTPVPLELGGYRIVVQAGDQAFIFHTDSERVIPCDPVNEQLPAGLLPTEEPTAEPTPEVTPEPTGRA